MNIEINVPSSLSEITLGQYQKFLKIAENNQEGNFLDAKMIEIFCGIPLSDSYKLKMSSVTDTLITALPIKFLKLGKNLPIDKKYSPIP